MGANDGCKVDRVIEGYDLDTVDPRHDSIDDGLLARWRGEDGHDAVGYRRLTEWFNRRLVRRVFETHGRDTLGTRVDHDYEALTGDDELRRQEVLESLQSDGIDARQLRSDMVSWGTMRTHLKDCLDGEKQAQQRQTDWEHNSVEMAKAVAREKAERALTSLASNGEITGVDHSSVSVQIQLQCNACPTRVPLGVALEQGYVCEQHSEHETTTDNTL